MEFWSVFVIGVLALCVIVLLVYLFSLRSSLKETARELKDKLKTDTNTLISISTGDSAVRALAAQINDQLRLLRRERLRLQHGDTELKNAVTNISHDLRTPLTAICGYLDLLAQQPQSEASKRYLAVIRERTDAMRELTEELFRYSVIAGAAEELTTEPVCLNDILEQSLAGFYGVLSEREIVPDIEIPEQSIVRTLDKGALRRIFDNILSNAAKYSDGDLAVTLSLDGTAIFENSAKELDTVQVAHLFDRFFTVSSARGGTGLGLSIAKLLTEKMGGSIAAQYREGKLCVSVRFSGEGRHQLPSRADRRRFGGFLSVLHHHACALRDSDSNDAAEIPDQEKRSAQSCPCNSCRVCRVHGRREADFRRPLADRYYRRRPVKCRTCNALCSGMQRHSSAYIINSANKKR